MTLDPISPPPRPLPALLTEVKMAAVRKLHARLAEQGHPDVREGYGCVFGFIDMERGSRLTDLAESSGFTKQAVGEAVTDLEKLGYVERLPDPTDGRAKIIKLTDWGVDAVVKARRLFAEIEAEWAEQIGPELVENLRKAATQIAGLEGAAVDASGRPRAAA
jgi:DNA-binding MarR family transcriptional regulator